MYAQTADAHRDMLASLFPTWRNACFLCSKAGAIGHAHRQQHLLGDRVHDRRAHSVAELTVDVPLAKGVLARALACMRLWPRERLWEPHEPGALARREEAW